MPFISYAQNYEDVILWRALRDVEEGFYVDVGAADPEEYSVTRAFYERGWSGINVEPLDDYFSKLTKARQRDTNLKIAVGREAGLRAFHAFFRTGLSTFDPVIAARHQAAGGQGNETVVPVLTLTKILEDCAPPVIHFLKIDVEGAEAEVLEGMNLDRFRPWIIVVKAIEPMSAVSTRGNWEHLVTDQGYRFAYSDGLNCFYVAHEKAELKERLAVPPNILDGFVQWPEWSCRQKAATLEQELVELRRHSHGLREALRVEQALSSKLQDALQAEQTQSASLQNALQAEQGQTSYLLTRIRQVETELGTLSVRQTIRRALGRVHNIGNQLTGGGLRASIDRLLTGSLHRGRCQKFLKALARRILRPLPRSPVSLRRLAKASETEAPAPSDSQATFTSPPPLHKDDALLVNSLYKTAFGRIAEEDALTNWALRLRSGMSLEELAGHLVKAPEFQTRHGSGQEVDLNYITALYRDGLERQPDLEGVASLMLDAGKGATRAKILASVAGSDEALAAVLLPTLGLQVAAKPSYAQWILDRERAEKHRFDAHHFEHSTAVRISFLVAGADSSSELPRTLQSIGEQTNLQWEVIFGMPSSGNENLLQDIGKVSAEDQRFVPVDAGAGDKASILCDLLPLTKGDFIVVLDPGDVVSPFALAEIEAVVSSHADAGIVYSDEDVLSAYGQRDEPFFKPEWSPDLLYAFNYFGRLTAIKRELVLQIGGFAGDMGSAVEWDLNLRLTERSPRIYRIPKVLCHRTHESDRDRPFPNSSNAAFHRKAIKKFWAVRGIQAQVETQGDGTQRSAWGLVDPPLVSIVVPNKNKHALLRVCMDGILGKTDYNRKEVIIVDNGSEDPDTLSFYKELEQHPEIRIVHNYEQFNYSAVCNYGASYANGELLLFLNNDVEVLSSDWLNEMVRFAMRPGVGVVGTQLVSPTRALQHAGVVLGIHLTGLVFRNAPINEWGVFGSPNHPRNYLAIMGACQLVRREAFARVGGFDESYQVANSGVAMCLHAWRAGYRIAYTPFASLVHHEGASRGYHDPIQDMQRTAADIRRLGFTDDPYFHPELSASNPIPTLRANGDVSTKDNLQRDIVTYLSTVRPASLLDLYDDHEIQNATGLAREEFLWLPQPSDTINDSWSAARYCIDLLRTRFDLRLRFPRALSAGVASDYVKWITSTGGDELLLSDEARGHIKEIFAKGLGARVRQTYLFSDELKANFPIGLTPVGRRELFRWFARHGRVERELRLEEIWWFFLECAEDPAKELVRTYLFTPEWQQLYPDGLTVFGRHALATWLAAKFRMTENWTDPDRWPEEVSAAQQIRLAYNAREDWRKKHPDAMTSSDAAKRLLAWLTTPDAGLRDEARIWCSELPIASTAVELSAPGVNIIGHFCYPSGLRTSVEAIRDALNQVGIATSLRDIRTDQNDDPNHAVYTGMELYNATIVHTQPTPYFEGAFDQADLFERTPRTYRIAYWYWELDTIPQSWLNQWKLVDEVWAASNFVADALKQQFGSRVHTMFPGIQLGKFQSRPRSYFGLTGPDEFTFLFVFHLMSIMERKNPLGLIRAFKQAFPENEPVRLVLKASFGDRHPGQLQELYSAAASSNITFIDQVYSQDETLSLINACDAYISLHRSEGLGLTMAEAMLLGKPVIATRYSGNVDFMDDQNSLLVDYQLVQLGRAIPPYDADARWAEPSVDHAAHLMRQVYENRNWAAELGARARVDAHARMSLETAGSRMAERLLQISAERSGMR